MPLPPPAKRRQLHTRKILCEGFLREDKLWDIEAKLVDTKCYGYSNHDRGLIPAGEPIHHMHLRITLDLDMVIHAVATSIEYTPFRICPNASQYMQRLKGLIIGPGWMRQVRELIENHHSCTHLIELLGPLSTTAYQTMHQALEERAQANLASNTKRAEPAILDQCHSLSRDSEVVKVVWPEFYTGKTEEPLQEP